MADTLRKELKRPDQFVKTGKRWLEWGAHHRSTLLGAGGGVLALLAVVAGVFSYREANERQANADLAAALTTMQEERWVEAARTLQDVADRWGGGVGAAALLYAAQANVEAGQLDAAKATLESALGESSLPAYLRQQALYNLAFIAEQQGDAKAAAGRYGEAAKATGPFTGPALLAEARLRIDLGESDAAKELYRRYLDEFPDATDRTTIEARLSEI